MDQELKEQLKAARLKDYQAQMFILSMDVGALEAIGETEQADKCKDAIGKLEKSYKAVEAM